jgi:hypothetical protein
MLGRRISLFNWNRELGFRRAVEIHEYDSRMDTDGAFASHYVRFGTAHGHQRVALGRSN